MSQGYATIASPPSGISGNQYTILLNTNLQAVVTKHSGVTAPSSPQTYQDWLDTSTTPFTHKVYDGADWITVGFLDATNNRYTPSFDPSNNQSGTSYSIVSTDRGKLLTLNNASSVAVTLPQAGASFPDGWDLWVRNKGAGAVTVTPTTSTINGAANIVIPQGSMVYIRSDGTNYHASSIPSTYTQGFTGTDDATYMTPAKAAGFWKKGSDIASAGTLARPADANVGAYHEITGTTGVTALWSSEPGQRMFWFRFQGILTITHNATSLILLGAANITTTAGDIACFVYIGSNNWRMIHFQRADGSVLLTNGSVTYAKIQDVSAASRVLGRGSAGGAGDPEELTMGTGVSITGTVLSGSDAFANQLLHVQDEKASGTDGGGSTSGAYATRTLNTVKTNQISGASLATNQVTLPAGTYIAEWSSPTGDQIGSVRTRLQNVTDATTIAFGQTVWSNSGGAFAGTEATGFARFTLAGTKALEVQLRPGATVATDGLGIAAGFGDTEIYTILKIWKVG